jgi:hypothetical protein
VPVADRRLGVPAQLNVTTLATAHFRMERDTVSKSQGVIVSRVKLSGE